MTKSLMFLEIAFIIFILIFTLFRLVTDSFNLDINELLTILALFLIFETSIRTIKTKKLAIFLLSNLTFFIALLGLLDYLNIINFLTMWPIIFTTNGIIFWIFANETKGDQMLPSVLSLGFGLVITYYYYYGIDWQTYIEFFILIVGLSLLLTSIFENKNRYYFRIGLLFTIISSNYILHDNYFNSSYDTINSINLIILGLMIFAFTVTDFYKKDSKYKSSEDNGLFHNFLKEISSKEFILSNISLVIILVGILRLAKVDLSFENVELIIQIIIISIGFASLFISLIFKSDGAFVISIGLVLFGTSYLIAYLFDLKFINTWPLILLAFSGSCFSAYFSYKKIFTTIKLAIATLIMSIVLLVVSILGDSIITIFTSVLLFAILVPFVLFYKKEQ